MVERLDTAHGTLSCRDGTFSTKGCNRVVPMSSWWTDPVFPMLRQESNSDQNHYLSLLSTARGVSPLSESLPFHKDAIPAAWFFLARFPLQPVRLTASFRSRANISVCHDWCRLIYAMRTALGYITELISRVSWLEFVMIQDYLLC